MNKRIFLSITVLVLFAASIAAATQDSKAFFETPSSFELNHYDCELDFWLNVTGALGSPFSIQSKSTGFDLLHARYSFSNRDTLQELYGYDLFTNVNFFEDEHLNSFYAQDVYAHYVLVQDFKTQEFVPQLQVFEIAVDDETPDYWAVGGGSTGEIIKPITEETFYDSVITDSEAQSFKMNFTQAYDDTSFPTLTTESGNIKTKDSTSQFFGVTYTASDGMSMNQYADAICDMYAVTLYEMQNCSTIQWLMQESIDKEEMNLISVNFQELTAYASPGFHIKAGVLRNFGFSMFQRVKDNIYSTVSRIRENLMTRIPTSRVISGITSVPSGAGYYDKTAIGTTWWTKIFGVSAAAGGLQNSVFKIFGTIFSGTGLTVIGLGYVGIGLFRRFKGKRFLWKPWQRGWFK